jgi:hypothetical protein
MRQPAHVRPSWSVGRGACPRALGAKRVRVRIREKEGFKHYRVWRAPCYQVPKTEACTLGTLTSRWLESAFFASFLCRFGQRNDVPPRTVANSDKENSQHRPATDAESSNPASTPTECGRKPRATPIDQISSASGSLQTTVAQA